MNFWEAREAAKQGKTVKMVADFALAIKPKDFLCDNTWRNEHLDAGWEIVEEPTPRLHYISSMNPKYLIEVLVGGDGNLIYAKNV